MIVVFRFAISAQHFRGWALKCDNSFTSRSDNSVIGA